MLQSAQQGNTISLSEVDDQISFGGGLVLNTPSGLFDYDPNEGFDDIPTTSPFQPPIFSPLSNARTPSGFSPEHSSNSNHQETSTISSDAATRIEVIAEPYYGGKLRYRSDYAKNDHRQGVLKNRTKNSNYLGPAIRIPQQYLQPNGQYHIRVSLVTVINDENDRHYIHPYTLEHPSDESLNDVQSNSVCFPIQGEECVTGIKSFPSIRIVKKLQSELKSHGHLQPFDNYSNVQSSTYTQVGPLAVEKKIYEIEKTQLAFTVVRKFIIENRPLIDPVPGTTQFSAAMIEGDSQESDSQNDNPSSAGSTSSSITPCRVYKYAPRYTLSTDTTDMIIVLTNKLEPKKYGALQVTFECHMVNPHWSHSITDVDVKDRILSFKTPLFPYQFSGIVPVKVILQQDKRSIAELAYFYISTLEQCCRCQLNMAETQTDAIPNTSNKRSASDFYDEYDFVSNSVTPAPEGPPVPESSSPPAAIVPRSAPASPVSTAEKPVNPSEEIMRVLAESVESLFLNNDYTRLIRVCRIFVKKRPELLHQAVDKNHSDLLSKFIPIASIDLLQQRNDSDENALVHAVRLNQMGTVKAVLEKTSFEALLEDLDEKRNNIFHFMASHSTSTEMIDLIINTLLEKNISIGEKFDHSNQDHQTPLQLSIMKKNLSLTKKLLKYSRTNLCVLNDHTGDNLIHLAVRYSDVEMIRYLIEDGQLKQLGNQSNLTMTPTELAQSLQHDDMANYLQTVYPPPQLSDDTSESSGESEDDGEN